MFNRKKFFLVISLISFFKLSALIKDDFYINGELIHIDLPPYFDFECNCCEYHRMNWPKGVPWQIKRKSNVYDNVHDIAKTNLKKALSPIIYDFEWPPYFWPQRDEAHRDYFISGWQQECRDLFIEFILKRFSNYFSTKYKTCSHHLEYSQYFQKYGYFYYLFNFYYDFIELGFKNEIERIIAKYKKEKGFIPIYGNYEIELINKKIKKLPENKKQTLECLDCSLEEIRNLFLLHYNGCLNEDEQKNTLILYERGKILHEKGETLDFVKDIFELAELGYSIPHEFEIGQAYNEIHLYNNAIEVFSKILKKDPKNKEAYFERALAYFEKGNFDLAIEDYINSSFKPTKLNETDKNLSPSLSFAKGIGLGCLKGSSDSIVDFVPSLLYSMHGIGTSLWAFTSSPIEYSKEFIESAQNCIEYIKENISLELLEELVPELRDCITKWNELDDEKKGYFFGYVIGKYGVDILAWSGCAKGIQLFRNLKKANAVLTLEKAISAKEIACASKSFFKVREEYKANCWFHLGQQEKHIPGANNFIQTDLKSETLISVKEIEECCKPRLGNGMPRRFSFGESGYQEVHDFDKIIGMHVAKNGKRTPTSIGVIHINKEGGYHLVPIHPESTSALMLRKLNK